MSRYIDADALGICKANRDVFENKAYADGWNAAIDIIESAPTADVAEVVRLKDGLDDCHIVSDGEYCGYDCGDVARLIEKLQNKIAVQAHVADIGKMVEMPPTADVTEVVGEYNGLTAVEQLNLYRNKYYSDGNATERWLFSTSFKSLE